MIKSSKVMLAYGGFLVAGALIAISISGWDRSKTALFSSGGAAALMAVMAVLANLKPNAAKMVGIHLGMVLPLAFAFVFGQRLMINLGKPSVEAWMAANPGRELVTAEVQSSLQNWLFPLFIAGSIAAFVGILLTRPKKEDRQEA